MDGDVKLNGDTVIIEGRVIQATATDVILDNKERRRKNASPISLRRALVHNFDDGLTINFAGDYPGGVQINGPVTLPGGPLTAPVVKTVTIMSMASDNDIVCTARGLRIFNSDAGGTSDLKAGPAISHAKNDTLALNEGRGYAGGVRVFGTLRVDNIVQAGTGSGLGATDFKFFDQIVMLVAQVAQLQTKVTALEAKVAKLEKKK